MRRVPKVAWIAVAVLLGLLVLLLVAGLVVQSSALSAYIERSAVPALSQKMGRSIDVGQAKAKVLFRPHVELSRLVVAGAPGEPPLLSAGRATATVELWPFLWSWGRDIRVSAVELDDATVNVIRRPDGSFSHDDVVRNLKQNGQAQGESPSKGTLEIQEARVRSGKVAYFDESRRTQGKPVPLIVYHIDATVRAPGHEGFAAADLRASWAAKEQNVVLRLWKDGNAHLRGTVVANGMNIEELRKALPPGDAADLSGGLATLHADFDAPTNQAAPTLASAHVATELHVDRLASSGLSFTDIATKGELAGGVYVLRSATANFNGGKIDASGSSIDLRSKVPAWHAIARASQVDLARTLASFSKGDRAQGATFAGQLNGSGDLRGRGMALAPAERTLVGEGNFDLSNVSVAPPFVAEVVTPATSLLSGAGIGGGPSNMPDAHWAQGGKVHAKFTVAGGSAKLVGPLEAQFPAGKASLEGRIGLNGTLALEGPVSLEPGFVGSFTAGKLTPPNPLVLSVSITGTAAHPVAKPNISPSDIAKDLVNKSGSGVRSLLPRGFPHLW